MISYPFKAEWCEDLCPAVSGIIATLTDSERSVCAQAMQSFSDVSQFGLFELGFFVSC
jgi:hypothetical protein